MAERQTHFGQLLQQTREAAGLSRDELARRVGLNASYIYRMEVGDRRPSREAALALADTLGVDDDAVNQWLTAAGYAPIPLLGMVRAAVRTRGGARRSRAEATPSSGWDAARWARSLEAMGLREAMVGRLLQAIETVGLAEQQEVAKAVSTTFSRIAERLESAVQTAVIPAAGGQHRIVAAHVMQRLLLGAIGEAAESGISNVILVLALGTGDSLYTPLKEALNLSVVPSIKLHYVEQAKPEGLGDAILQAEPLVSQKPFAVLLPDDVVRERTATPRELRRMMDALRQLGDAHLVAVTPVPKSKMRHCGVAQAGAKEVMPNVRPILQLIEKPEPTHSIYRSTRAFGIVGRYLLQPGIFPPLRQLKEEGRRPVHLTDALERLRQEGHPIYAFELEARREDVGEVLGQARELMGDSSGSSSTA